MTFKRSTGQTWMLLAIASFFLIFLFSIFLAVVLLLPRSRPFSEGTPFTSAERKHSLFVTSNGHHTSLILPLRSPVMDWGEIISLKDVTSLKWLRYEAKWISFGWGEREFFANTPQFADISIKLAFHSLFLAEEFVLLIGLSSTEPQSSPSVIELGVTSSELEAVSQFVKNTLILEEDGRAQRDLDGYTNRDAFFKANGSYSPLFTCNTWVSESLGTIDATRPLWSGLAPPLMWHLAKDPRRRQSTQ